MSRSFLLPVEPHGQTRGTTWFRRFASQTAGLSGATSRLQAHSSTAKAVAFCGRDKKGNLIAFRQII